MKKLAIHAVLTTALLGANTAAKASEWGCEVLLCLSNPAGPMAVAECVSPITRLWKALRKRHPDPFPTCEEAGDSFARQGFGYYDRCPDGTAALASSEVAVQMSSDLYAQLSASNPAYFGRDLQPTTRQALTTALSSAQIGIGEGNDARAPSSGEDAGAAMRPKICVGGELGAVVIPGASWEEGSTRGTAYERVVTLQPAASPLYIDVLVNGKFYNRVRY